MEVPRAVKKLVRYKGTNRYGGRDVTLCIDPKRPGYTCGGDDWTTPTVRSMAERITTVTPGVLWNDFGNMNGDFFTPHGSHRTGLDIDGTFPGYTVTVGTTKRAGALAAETLAQMFNGLVPSERARIEAIYVAYDPDNPEDPFRVALQNATWPAGVDRFALVRPDKGHWDHFHIRFKSE